MLFGGFAKAKSFAAQRKSSKGEPNMPKLTVDGVGEFEVPAGKRLVLALVDEAGRRSVAAPAAATPADDLPWSLPAANRTR